MVLVFQNRAAYRTGTDQIPLNNRFGSCQEGYIITFMMLDLLDIGVVSGADP